MHPSAPASTVFRRASWWAVLTLALPLCAHAELPARSQWKASSSSTENPSMTPAMGIDGDPKTRWGGPFSAGHWYQLDLGRTTAVGGVLIQWEGGFPTHYFVRHSNDGTTWSDAIEVTGGVGSFEYVFFPTVQARYLRLAAPDRTADWGVSVAELQPIAAAPDIDGLSGSGDAGALWRGTAQRVMSGHQLDIALDRAIPVAGLELHWKTPPRSAQLQGRVSGSWITLAEEPDVQGQASFLASDSAHTVDALRVMVQPGDGAPVIDGLELLGPQRLMTPLRRYEVAATRRNAELFPSSLHQQQVYWTAVGVPAGQQKSVMDEYGDVEAFKGAPLVQPVWRNRDGKSAAAFNAKLKHALREGWMPMPSVEWQPQEGLTLRSETFSVEQNGAPITLVRHRLTNTGRTPVAGTFALITRPMQISPPWQNGGLSPIHAIASDASGVSVNGRRLFESLTPTTASGVAAFGVHGEGEITAHAAAGTVPAQQSVADRAGLGAAITHYDVQLSPGAHRDIVIAFALGNARIDTREQQWPQAPMIDRRALLGSKSDAGVAFDRLADTTAAQWQSRVGRIGLSLPDESLVDMLRAQTAYMLINQSGHAMQPGPRNYNRSFIRDGSATAAILLRMGMNRTARDYLDWYAEHAVHPNGLVSPILNDDGTVNTGFGSDLEHDSQGQFVWLVAEIARLDGGADTVRQHQEQVKRALRFLQELRERTMVPGYLAEREAPERFHGIIAPSISHEGYPVPTHSYWDDYWALKGWHDGAWLADQWGDADTARWAREQYAALRESVTASLRATMRWKGIDFIPASADLGESDPTSVSIGIDPAGQQDVMPQDALERTFARYLADVRKRDEPGALYAYTPYEMRNVLTYVHLGQPAEANELLKNFLRHRRPAEWQVIAEVVYSDLRHAIYLGDMPHTWIGAEYVRSIFGMLMFEADDHLSLLPGAPPEWVAGPGLAIEGLPTAYGRLGMKARREGDTLRISLDDGLRANTPVRVSWPGRVKPQRVIVDGVALTDFDASGIRLVKPFKRLEATW